MSFDDAMAGAETFDLDGCAIPVIGLVDLLRATRAAGRPQDLLDVDALETLHGEPGTD